MKKIFLQTCLKVYKDAKRSMTLLLGTHMAIGMHKSQLMLWAPVNYIPHSAKSFAVVIFMKVQVNVI